MTIHIYQKKKKHDYPYNVCEGILNENFTFTYQADLYVLPPKYG